MGHPWWEDKKCSEGVLLEKANDSNATCRKCPKFGGGISCEEIEEFVRSKQK